jgi:thiosulfate reductase cytochrome b subunit
MTQTRGQKNEIKLNVMSEQIKNIQRDIEEIKTSIHDLVTKIDDTYVTKEEFKPTQRIVYGMVGAILMAVLGALIQLTVVH